MVNISKIQLLLILTFFSITPIVKCSEFKVKRLKLDRRNSDPEMNIGATKEAIIQDNVTGLIELIKTNKYKWYQTIGDDGDTILHNCVNFGAIKCLKYILNLKGVNINIKNDIDQTPYERAIYLDSKIKGFTKKVSVEKSITCRNAKEILEILKKIK